MLGGGVEADPEGAEVLGWGMGGFKVGGEEVIVGGAEW